MRRTLFGIGLLLASAAHAGSGTLRVGSQVLVVGDSATRVEELLGKPSYRSHTKASSNGGSRKSSKSRRAGSKSTGGEQWQYRSGNRVTTIVIADGKVSAIRDGGG
jgi:hypothetical protein